MQPAKKIAASECQQDLRVFFLVSGVLIFHQRKIHNKERQVFNLKK